MMFRVGDRLKAKGAFGAGSSVDGAVIVGVDQKSDTDTYLFDSSPDYWFSKVFIEANYEVVPKVEPENAPWADVTIDIRLPGDIFVDLAIEAAQANMTINDYIIKILRDEVSF